MYAVMYVHVPRVLSSVHVTVCALKPNIACWLCGSWGFVFVNCRFLFGFIFQIAFVTVIL